MKSNLTKEDYLYLINKAMVTDTSYLSIKINDIRGEIKCYRVLLKGGNIEINGSFNPSIYKYAFKLYLNNINYENIYKFVEENQEIAVDDIKYYLGTYTITNKDSYQTEIVYASYNLYKLEDFN